MKKLFTLSLTFTFILSTFSLSFAVPKSDVKDPVLREIINEMERKLPKFVDKYGETVFVQDGTVTRGDLLQALYEYDKKTKSSQSQQESNDIAELRAKIAALQKTSAAKSAAGADEKEIAALRKTLSDMQTSYAKLSKRVDEISLQESFDSSLRNPRDSSYGSNTELTAIKREIEKSQSKTFDDIRRIETKLNEVSSQKGSGKDSKTGTIAGVSLGLTLLAALFVAR